MQKRRSPSSEDNKDKSNSDDSEVQSQSNLIDSEPDDASSFMDESNASDQSEVPEDDIKIQKVEDKSTGTKMTEFSINLPDRLTSYENFVWLIEPLIEKIEDYIENNGEVNKEAVNTGRPSDIEPDKKFEPMNAVHFTGAILQSVLEIQQEQSNLTFRLEEPRSKAKAAKMKELVLKPIIERSNTKGKNNSRVYTQEFIITCQEDFDPFVEFDEREVLSELAKIIESYELIFKENELENRPTIFDQIDGLDEALKPKKLKSAQKKKGKASAAEKEAAELLKAKAEMLLKEVREAEQTTPQKSQSGPKRGRKPQKEKETPKEFKELFGGEIEISRCKPEEIGRVPSQKEKELREFLVSQFNNPSGEDFLTKLQSALMDMSSIRISLYTAVLLSVVFYQSAKSIDNVTLADMSSFMKISNFIPFPTTPALRALNCGYLVAQCIDLLMNVETDNCMPRSTYFPAVHEFDHENYYMNVISASLCPKFLDLYLMPEIKVTTPHSARLSQYESQLLLLNKIFDFFANQPDEADKENGNQRKDSLSPKVVQKILDEIKRVSGIKEYAECEYLVEIHDKLVKGVPVTLEKIEKKPEVLETLKKGKISVRKEALDFGTAYSRASQDVRMIEERPTRVINFEDMEAEEEEDDDEDFIQPRKLRRRRSALQEEKKPEEKETKPKTRGRKKAIKKESPNKNEKMDIEIEKPQERMKIETEKELTSTEKPKKKRGRKPKSEKKNQESPSQAHDDNKMAEEKMEADVDQNRDNEEIRGFELDIDESKLDLSKKDLKARKIEKEHAKSMKAFFRRSTLAGAKSEVASIQSTTSNSNLKKKKDKLTERIQKTEEWLKEYQQKVVVEGKSIDQIQDLIEDILELNLRAAEMENLMEKQRLFLLWRVKLDALLKKFKKRKRKNESGQLNLIAFEELEIILNEADVLKITNLSDEPRFEELRAKYKKIQAIKQTIESGSNDLNGIRKASKELSDTNISYPALADAIQEKIELNERIILFLETTVSVDTFSEFVESLRDKSHLMDPALYKCLEEKHEEGNRYKDIVTTLEIPRATYEYEQVSLINAAVTAIRSLKIEIPNQRLLNSIVLSFKWLLKLERFLRKSNEMVPETNEGVEGAEGTEVKPKEIEVSLTEKFEPEHVVKYCTEWLDTFNAESVDEKTITELKRLLKEARGFKIADQRIDALFRGLSLKVCGNERGIFEEPKKTSDEQAEKIEVEDNLQMILESEEASENYKNWNDLYIQTISTDLESFLRNKGEVCLRESALKTYLMDLKRNLETLVNEYDTNLKQYINLEDKVGLLRRYQGWLEWLVSADEYMKQMDNKFWIPFEQLKDLYLLAKKSEIPRPWALNKKVEEKYTQAESLLSEYKTRFLEDVEKQKGEAKSPAKGSIQQRIDAKKPTVVEAKRLKTNLKKKIPFINCEQESVHLDTMVDEQSKWKLRADEFVQNNCAIVLNAAVHPTETLSDFEAIESHLKQLEEDYLNSNLRDESNEKMLIGIEYLFQSYRILKNLSRETTLEEWEKIVKYIEENPGFIDLTEEKALLKALKAPIQSVKEQNKFVKNLKSLTQRPAEPLTLLELKSFLTELKYNSIKLPDDERFIEDLIQKITDLADYSRKICDVSKKDPLIEFTKAFEQIKRLPINLPDEEKQLEEAINFANRIATFIRKFSNIDLYSTEKILNEYKTCPVSISEAEKLSEKFEKSKTMYDRVKFKLNDVEDAKNYDYDQVKEIVDNINEVSFDFDGNLTYTKAQVYSLYVKHLQKLAGNQDSTSNNKVASDSEPDTQEQASQKPTVLSSQIVKSLAKEGHDLKNALIEQQKDTAVLNQALFWIDNLSRRLDAKLQEINAVSSVEVLDRMPKLLLGFVDLTQNFNEKRAIITGSGPSVHKPTTEETSGIFTNQLTKASPGKAKKTQKQLKDFFRDKKEDPSKEKKEGLQKEASENKPSQQLTTVQKEMDKSEKQIMENLESKNLVSRLQDKIKESSQNPSKRGRKRKNKEKSEQAEDDYKPQRKAKQATTNSEPIIEPPTEEMNKIDPKKSRAVSMIREILLNNNADLHFDAENSITIAHSIVAAFPVLDESKEKLTKFAGFFKSVLKLPNIYRKLIEKSFPSKLLSKLYAKSASELVQLDRKLNDSKQSKPEKVSKPETETETYEGEAIKKKLKAPVSSQPANMFKEETNDLLSLEESLRLPPEHSLKRDSMNQGNLPQLKEKAENSREALLGPLSTNLPRAMRPVSMPIEEEMGFQQSSVQNQERFPSQAGKHEGRNQNLKYGYNQSKITDFQNSSHSQLRNAPYNRARQHDKMEEEGSRAQVEKKTLAKVPQEEILKIFDGKLKESSEENALRIGLYTCDPVQTVKTFPQIVSEANNLLMIEGKMSFSNFESYVNKWISTLDEDKGEIISGWVESSNPVHQEACERISNMFLKSMKIGVTKYSHSCAKIFFIHESQFFPDWVEKFNFQKKKLHKNSYSSLYALIMFQPSKFPFDLSSLQRIEPELIPPYREKSDESGSGGSTPEIEPYSQSLTRENVDDNNERSDEFNEVNTKSQQTFGFNLGPKKTPGRTAPQMTQEEKPNPYKRVLNQDMEIEKEIDDSVEEMEAPFDTQRLLNQPMARVMDDADSGKLPRDMKTSRGLKESAKPEDEEKRSVKKNFYIKPQFDDASVIVDSRRVLPRENTQVRNEQYGRPKGQFGDHTRLGYTDVPTQKPRNYIHEQDNAESQTSKRSNFNEFLRSVQDKLFPHNSRRMVGKNQGDQSLEKQPYDPDNVDDEYSGSENPKPEGRQYITPNPQMHLRLPQKSQYQSQSPASTFPRNDRNTTGRFSGDNARDPVQKGTYGYNRSPNYNQSPYSGRPQAQVPKDQDDVEYETNVNAPKRFQPAQNRWKPQTTFTSDTRGGTSFKYQKSQPAELNDDQIDEEDEVEEVPQEKRGTFGSKAGKYQRDFNSSQYENRATYQRASHVEKPKSGFNYSNSNDAPNLQGYRYSANQRNDNYANRTVEYQNNRKFSSSQLPSAQTANKAQPISSKLQQEPSKYAGGSYKQTTYQQDDDSIDLGYDHQNEGQKSSTAKQTDSGMKGWASKRDNYPSRKSFEPARQFMGGNNFK